MRATERQLTECLMFKGLTRSLAIVLGMITALPYLMILAVE